MRGTSSSAGGGGSAEGQAKARIKAMQGPTGASNTDAGEAGDGEQSPEKTAKERLKALRGEQ